MAGRRRRFLAYLGAFFMAVLVFSLAYVAFMAVFEGESRTIVDALLVVVETFTTTGYGEDAGAWDSPVVVALMIVMQFTGVVFIFMALPLFVVPWMEQRLSTRPPEAVEGLSDHVVICSLTERIGLLVDELDAAGVSYVVVEPDRERATELVEDGHTVVHGDPESENALEGACLGQARALVADVDDEVNASIALTAANSASASSGTGERPSDGDGDVHIITFAEDPSLAQHHRHAGADTVLTPQTLLAESLANKVTAGVTAEVGDAIEIAEDFEIAEMPVQPGSELAGRTLAQCGIRERTGANVIGAWFRGEFQSPPSPESTIDERTILLVAGRERQLEALKSLTLADTRTRRRGRVVVCGYGEVGSTIAQRVRASGIACTIVDSEDSNAVDVVGDVTESETLERADLADASTVILALSDDTDAIFATLVVRQLDPEIEVVARANHTESVRKLYRAGADYVLALGTVSGRMLASTVLEEDVISYDQGVEIIRSPAGELAGQTVEGADILGRTGCTVLAIEREEEVITDFAPSFRFREDDEVVVAGTDESVHRFTALVT
ncbi:MAG: TrkA family potassium uptake protein [Haloarculaceae archaeon]